MHRLLLNHLRQPLKLRLALQHLWRIHIDHQFARLGRLVRKFAELGDVLGHLAQPVFVGRGQLVADRLHLFEGLAQVLGIGRQERADVLAGLHVGVGLGRAVFQFQCPADAGDEVLAELGVGPGLVGMPEIVVEEPALADLRTHATGT